MTTTVFLLNCRKPGSMPPQLRPRRLQASFQTPRHITYHPCHHQYATAASATTVTTPAPSVSQMTSSFAPSPSYPPSQPPSHRSPTYRKSQLLRSYVSLLQTTPLMLFFQHNNLTAVEWTAIRRELASAINKLDESLRTDGHESRAAGAGVKLQIIRTTAFEPALRIAEYYHQPTPFSQQNSLSQALSSSPSVASGTTPRQAPSSATTPSSLHLTPTHSLSESAYKYALTKKAHHPLTPLLIGPLALLTFPTVSPLHLKTALQILSPLSPDFPAPKRKANPNYWDPTVQDGVKKLMLLAARVDGQVFDMDGARWLGGINGGMEGLRAQLVHMLQGFGVGLAQTLQGMGTSLYVTMDSRRRHMAEGEKEESSGQAGSDRKEDGKGEDGVEGEKR